jgi:hypothetical protein
MIKSSCRIATCRGLIYELHKLRFQASLSSRLIPLLDEVTKERDLSLDCCEFQELDDRSARGRCDRRTTSRVTKT